MEVLPQFRRHIQQLAFLLQVTAIGIGMVGDVFCRYELSFVKMYFVFLPEGENVQISRTPVVRLGFILHAEAWRCIGADVCLILLLDFCGQSFPIWWVCVLRFPRWEGPGGGFPRLPLRGELHKSCHYKRELSVRLAYCYFQV